MMQVTKVWWDGERLMAEPIDPTTIYQEPAQKPQRWAVFCQGCRKEWSVSYPHPGKDICVDCDDKLAQQDSTCSNTLRAQGKAYPRTCKKCGLGPCIAARVQPALEQQEPVAYMVKAHGMLQRLSRRADVADEIACQYRKDDPNAEVLPLYTSPPAHRKPLTDDELADLWYKQSLDWMEFARAIEAAHGIKENT